MAADDRPPRSPVHQDGHADREGREAEPEEPSLHPGATSGAASGFQVFETRTQTRCPSAQCPGPSSSSRCSGVRRRPSPRRWPGPRPSHPLPSRVAPPHTELPRELADRGAHRRCARDRRRQRHARSRSTATARCARSLRSAAARARSPTTRRGSCSSRIERGDRLVVVDAPQTRSRIAASLEDTRRAVRRRASRPDRATVLVSRRSRDRALVAYDARSGAERWRVALSAEPRGIAVSPDGKRALISSIDTGAARPRRARRRASGHRDRVRSRVRSLRPTAPRSRAARLGACSSMRTARSPRSSAPCPTRSSCISLRAVYGASAARRPSRSTSRFSARPTAPVRAPGRRADRRESTPLDRRGIATRDTLYVAGLGVRHAAPAPRSDATARRRRRVGAQRAPARPRATGAAPTGSRSRPTATCSCGARSRVGSLPRRSRRPGSRESDSGRRLRRSRSRARWHRAVPRRPTRPQPRPRDHVLDLPPRWPRRRAVLADREAGAADAGPRGPRRRHASLQVGRRPTRHRRASAARSKRLGGTGLAHAQTTSLVAYLEALPRAAPPDAQSRGGRTRQGGVRRRGDCGACHDGPRLHRRHDAQFTSTLPSCRHAEPDRARRERALLPRRQRGHARRAAPWRGKVHGMADIAHLTDEQRADLAAFLSSL